MQNENKNNKIATPALIGYTPQENKPLSDYRVRFIGPGIDITHELSSDDDFNILDKIVAKISKSVFRSAKQEEKAEIPKRLQDCRLTKDEFVGFLSRLLKGNDVETANCLNDIIKLKDEKFSLLLREAGKGVLPVAFSDSALKEILDNNQNDAWIAMADLQLILRERFSAALLAKEKERKEFAHWCYTNGDVTMSEGNWQIYVNNKQEPITEDALFELFLSQSKEGEGK